MKRQKQDVVVITGAVWGNKFFPGLGDWYLGRTGFASQQCDGFDDPNRPSNLFKPMDQEKDVGARGPFGGRAHNRSTALWLFTRPGHPAIGVAGLLGFVAWAARRVVLSYRRKD